MMLYVSFCKEVESQWASLKKTSEVYFARYHFTTGLPLSVGYLVVNSVTLDWNKLKKPNVFVVSSSDESLLTSCLRFGSLAYELTHRRHNRLLKLNWKVERVGWFAQFYNFQLLEVITKEVTAIENCEIAAGWQKRELHRQWYYLINHTAN